MKPVHPLILLCSFALLTSCGHEVALENKAAVTTQANAPLNNLGPLPASAGNSPAMQLNALAANRSNLLTGHQWYRCRTWPWQTRTHTPSLSIGAGECFYMTGPVNPGQQYHFSCRANSQGSATIDIVYYRSNWDWLSYDWSYVDESGASVRSTAPAGTSAGAVTLWAQQDTTFRNCTLVELQAPSMSTTSLWRPNIGDSWHWQLTGSLNTNHNVDIYDIDLFDNSANTIRKIQNNGAAVICYLSAGSFEVWRPDAQSFSASVLGTALDGWPGERWLDIRAHSIRNIMAARLDLAQRKGCDAIEPDNMDGYTQDSGFNLTFSDQINYNRWLANAAHASLDYS